MSKMTLENEKFIKDCTSVGHKVLTSWADYISCFYDGATGNKRDYVLQARNSWGKSQCDWSNKRVELFEELKKVGAINIIGRVDYNYIDIAFDIRKTVLKANLKEVTKCD